MDTDTAISILFLTLLAVSSVAALWSRFRRRSVLGLGVRGVPVGRDLLVGAGIGTLGIAVTAVLLLVSGHADLTGVGLDPGRLLLALVVLGGAAVAEELVYRVLMLGGLLRLTGSAAVALVVSAAVFGLVHLTDSTDATAVSVLSNALGGVMYGVAFLRTGRIWMPVGLHFAWNLVQGTVLGFTISGDTDYSGALVHATTSGATWASGAGYGPEGSVFSLVGRAVVIVLVVLATRDRAARLGAGPRRPART